MNWYHNGEMFRCIQNQLPLHTGFKGKAPAANIYALIISDLTDAAAKLPASYSGADLGRATKGAANALLGRVKMQKGDYAAAKTALLLVHNSGLYTLQLVPFLWNFDGDVKSNNISPAETGHEFNAESVFEVAFVDKGDNILTGEVKTLSSTAPGSIDAYPGLWHYMGQCNSF